MRLPYSALAWIYDRLFGDPFFPLLRRNFNWLVRAHPIRTDSVADVACGTGTFVKYLCSRGIPQVIGVDRSPDMLKIGQLYLEEGRWHGRQIVSSEWVKESTTNQLTKEQATSDGPYGYLWGIGAIESHPYFAAFGSYGQHIIVVPDSRLVVVTVCDESGFGAPTEEFVNTFNDVIFKPILRA